MNSGGVEHAFDNAGCLRHRLRTGPPKGSRGSASRPRQRVALTARSRGGSRFSASRTSLRSSALPRHTRGRERGRDNGGSAKSYDELRRERRDGVVVRDTIHTRLGIAAATVRVHLTRGRRHLAALLGDEEATDR